MTPTRLSPTRLAKTTTRTTNGTRVTRTTIKPRAVQEWEIQAEAVRRLRAHPDFDRKFTLAGDMAAAKRSRQGATIAKATGLVPGDPDLRLYLQGGRLCMIEYKAGKGRESTEQVDRIALLDTLGFTVVVVRAETADAGATRTMELVNGWLAECASTDSPPAGLPHSLATDAANDDEAPLVGLKMNKGK